MTYIGAQHDFNRVSRLSSEMVAALKAALRPSPDIFGTSPSYDVRRVISRNGACDSRVRPSVSGPRPQARGPAPIVGADGKTSRISTIRCI